MKTHTQSLRLRASVLAVHGALALMASAHAETDPAVLALTTPKNTVEVGVQASTRDSAKANEFNGRRKGGSQLVADFELLGGGAFDGTDATRWRVTGSDLGSDARALSGEYGEQGRFRIKATYDELRHRASDTFQTPYLANGNVFSLPPTWTLPAGGNARALSPTVVAPTAAQTANLATFHLEPLGTKREKLGLGGEVQINSRWSTFVSASHEHKEGKRALNTVTVVQGVTGVTGDQGATLAAPVDQEHYQYRLGANYLGDGYTFQAAYDGSAFVNNIDSIKWSGWSDVASAPRTSAAQPQTMATDPSNQYHKVSLNGTYDLSKATKVVGAMAYGRGTQNDPYVVGTSTGLPLLPVSSLNGVVVTETATVKVVHKASKDLSLNAGYKFDLRDNQTPVNTYGFYDINEALAAGTSVFGAPYRTNINLNANRPYSRRTNQLNLDADYKLAPTQNVNLGWETKNTDKYCNGSWYNCADADKSMEHTARAELRLNPSEELSARLALSKARRKVDYDENAFLSLVPYANVLPSTAPVGVGTAYDTLMALGLTGYGPISGFNPVATAGSALAFYFPNNNALANALYGNRNRISELPGMRRYNNANRDRNTLRASTQWQATDAFTLDAGVDYKHDRYSESVYGLQKTEAFSLNLEGTYAPSDTLSISAFYTFDNQRSLSAGNTYTANSNVTNVNGKTAILGSSCYSNIATRNLNNKTDPCNNWNALTVDRVDTLGLTLTKSRLFSGKVDLSGSLIVSQARTGIDVSGGSYVNAPTTDTTYAAYYIPAIALPTLRSNAEEIRLSGLYRLDAKRAVRVGYAYRHLTTSDFAYEALQLGTNTKEDLPTNEKSPSFSVHSVGISYIAEF